MMMMKMIMMVMAMIMVSLVMTMMVMTLMMMTMMVMMMTMVVMQNLQSMDELDADNFLLTSEGRSQMIEIEEGKIILLIDPKHRSMIFVNQFDIDQAGRKRYSAVC